MKQYMISRVDKDDKVKLMGIIRVFIEPILKQCS